MDHISPKEVMRNAAAAGHLRDVAQGEAVSPGLLWMRASRHVAKNLEGDTKEDMQKIALISLALLSLSSILFVAVALLVRPGGVVG
jgi:hypothetical protein